MTWVKQHYGVQELSSVILISGLVTIPAGFIGGWIGDRFGSRRSYIGLLLTWAATTTALIALFKMQPLFYATPVAFLTLIIILESLKKFSARSYGTVERTIPVSIFRGNVPESYNGYTQFIAEIPSIVLPIFFIGWAIAAFGLTTTMAVMPALLLAAVAVTALFVKYKEAEPAVTPSGAAKSETRKDPALLKFGILAYPVYLTLNAILYESVGLGYGWFLHPDADAAAGGATGGVLGFFSAGGLLAAVFTTEMIQKIWRSGKNKGATHKAYLRSMTLWTALSALGLGSFGVFLQTDPLVTDVGMLVFGFTQVMGNMKLLNLWQNNVPLEKKGRIMGKMRLAAMILSTLASYGFMRLLSFFPASPIPFVVLMFFAAGVAGFLLWIAYGLRRYANSPDAA